MTRPSGHCICAALVEQEGDRFIYMAYRVSIAIAFMRDGGVNGLASEANSHHNRIIN
jgi:hypothetical protein